MTGVVTIANKPRHCERSEAISLGQITHLSIIRAKGINDTGNNEWAITPINIFTNIELPDRANCDILPNVRALGKVRVFSVEGAARRQ